MSPQLSKPKPWLQPEKKARSLPETRQSSGRLFKKVSKELFRLRIMASQVRGFRRCNARVQPQNALWYLLVYFVSALRSLRIGPSCFLKKEAAVIKYFRSLKKQRKGCFSLFKEPRGVSMKAWCGRRRRPPRQKEERALLLVVCVWSRLQAKTLLFHAPVVTVGGCQWRGLGGTLFRGSVDGSLRYKGEAVL